MELSITQEDAGHTAEGLPLFIFALCNRHGMEVRLSTLGGAIASLRAPDRNGRLADVIGSDVSDCGIHLLPAPGRALHRLPWHAVPLVEDASVGVRLVSPGPQSVVRPLSSTKPMHFRCIATHRPPHRQRSACV